MDFKEQNTINGGASPKKQPMERRQYIAITAVIAIVVALITFCATYLILDIAHKAQLDTMKEKHQAEMDSMGEFKSIAELYNSLPEELRNMEMYKKLAYLDYYYRTSYVGEIDEENLVYMVANGYIAGAGDIFGAYYTADEFATLISSTQGSTVGIGVYVSGVIENNGIKILYVMQNGPAHQAELLPGDIITHIDKKPVVELGYYKALDMVRGTENTNVELTIRRGSESITKVLTRKTVETQSVIAKKHESDPTVGVIRIIEFNEAVPLQFKQSVDALIKGGCTSLVFDLRSNPGGTLNSVVDILDYLLPAGDLVTTRGADGEIMQKLVSDEGPDEFKALYGDNIKMAVLVNGNTASAAELFTCALKDYGRAVIVGEKTYGKGCGQQVLMLPDGTGLSITTFLYDPPKSANYNGKGIEPDVKRSLSEEASKTNIFELKHEDDDQLKAALEALKK